MQVLVLERVALRYWNTGMMVIVFRITGALLRGLYLAQSRWRLVGGAHTYLVSGWWMVGRPVYTCHARLTHYQNFNTSKHSSKHPRMWKCHCGEPPIWCPRS